MGGMSIAVRPPAMESAIWHFMSISVLLLQVAKRHAAAWSICSAAQGLVKDGMHVRGRPEPDLEASISWQR